MSGAELILPLVGTGVSAIQQFNIARGQEKVAKQQAETEAQAARLEASQEREEGRRFRAKQAAQFGAAGVELRGTPLDVLAETAEEQERDVLFTLFAGERRKTKFLGEAALAKGRRFKGFGDVLTTAAKTDFKKAGSILTGKKSRSISGSQGGVG